MTVGERLKKLRLERGLTQTEVGEVLGVTKGAIHKYETGQIQGFKRESAYKLASLFGISPLHFIFDEIPDFTKERESVMRQSYQRNIELSVKSLVVEEIREMVQEYEQDQEVFNEGANPYLDGLVDGMHKIIKKLESDIQGGNINE